MARSSSGTGRTWVRWWIFAPSPRAWRQLALAREGSFTGRVAHVTPIPIALLCVLCALILWPGAAARAQVEWTVVSTPRFRVEAVNDHAAQASWYAAFVE